MLKDVTFYTGTVSKPTTKNNLKKIKSDLSYRYLSRSKLYLNLQIKSN